MTEECRKEKRAKERSLWKHIFRSDRSWRASGRYQRAKKRNEKTQALETSF